MKPLFAARGTLYTGTSDCFSKILNLEVETRNPRFVDWLVDKRGFEIKREMMSESRIVVDYEIKVKGDAVLKTIGRAMEWQPYDVLREDIRGDYDT